jgi:hypothetical protein
MKMESKGEQEADQRLVTPYGGVAPLGHATRGCDRLVHPLTSPFCLYILLDDKILMAQTLFQKTYFKPPPLSM